MRFLALLLVLYASVAGAAELSAQTLAKIRVELREALRRIDADVGDRLPGELTNDERRAVIAAQAEAQQRVLDQHGISLKAYVIYTSRMTLEEREQVAIAEKALVERQAASDRDAGAPAEGDIDVQRGFAEEAPPAKGGGDREPAPLIEYGTPAEEGLPPAGKR